ncbi:MAG TPA: tetratricopeptide repeat protein, partial [Gemmatimonadaceae bacterium]|nr:tetratricopeptide repeat protein [Gemmatimonadaceae bacterium]
ARPVADILAAGDQAWSAGRFDDAVERYQAVLEQDSTSLRALFRVATVLGWRHELERSAALFRVYLRLAPRDDDARIGLARTLAWRGEYDQAIALCDSVIARDPRRRDAMQLGAQALAWSGNVHGAISRYERWLSTHPDDAESWVGLANTWRWAGQREQTRQALQHAVAADPHNVDARTQLEFANVALSPSLEPIVSTSDDSDDNRATTYLVRGSLASLLNARVLGDASYRVADFGAEHGTSATLRGASSWAPGDERWMLRAEAGAARVDATDAFGSTHETRVLPLLGVRFADHPTRAITVGASATRAPFDETASLMRAGIATTSVGADAGITLGEQIGLTGDGSWTRLSGGSGPNSRLSGSGSLRWSPAALWSFAASVRSFAYDHAALDGYFTPKGYVLAEMSGRLHLGRELGWALDSELGLGNQTIVGFDNSRAGRFAQRASAAVAYRPAPGFEWSLSGGFANVASPTTISSADYRAYTVSINGRFRL